MNDRKTRDIIAIDLLRFACAIMVLGYHYGTSPAAPAEWTRASSIGWIGVEIFFVISGFVIAGSAAGATSAEFVRRRVRRLAPGAWICATLTLATMLWAGDASPVALFGRWIAAVLFWPIGPWIDQVYWTLGVECAFYGVVAVLLRRGNDPEQIERLAVQLAVASAGFWLVMAATGSLGSSIADDRLFQLLLLAHGGFFALGVLAWSIAQRGVTRSKLAAAAIAAIGGSFEIASQHAERVRILPLSVPTAIPLAVAASAIAIVFGAHRLQPWLARRVPARSAAMLGLATYPLYLLHQNIGAVAIGELLRAGWDAAASIALTTAAIVALALVVARRAEPWLRGVLDRGLSPPRPRPVNRSGAARADTLP